MLNSFSGLEMGKRALNAFRQGIETAGHNITNVYTEGYSRQRVNLSTTDPFTAPGLSSPAVAGQIGTGVKIDEIVRILDHFAVEGAHWLGGRFGLFFRAGWGLLRRPAIRHGMGHRPLSQSQTSELFGWSNSIPSVF
jgi:hypothetical protein